MKNKFCIRTRSPDHSKQIIDTLVRLGYKNKQRLTGNHGKDDYYAVDERNEIRGRSLNYTEIQLEDLEGNVNVKISFNYLIL